MASLSVFTGVYRLPERKVPGVLMGCGRRPVPSPDGAAGVLSIIGVVPGVANPKRRINDQGKASFIVLEQSPTWGVHGTGIRMPLVRRRPYTHIR